MRHAWNESPLQSTEMSFRAVRAPRVSKKPFRVESEKKPRLNGASNRGLLHTRLRRLLSTDVEDWLEIDD